MLLVNNWYAYLKGFSCSPVLLFCQQVAEADVSMVFLLRSLTVYFSSAYFSCVLH